MTKENQNTHLMLGLMKGLLFEENSLMKKKIVLLNCCKGLYGGVESFLLNIFRRVDKDKFEVTFLTCGISTYDMFIDEIKNNGGNIDCIDGFPDSLYNSLLLYDKLKRYFKENQPDVVHINSSGLMFQAIASRAAKKAKVSQIILHSHNFVPNISNTKKAIRTIISKFLTNNGTCFLSCSRGASEWMFENKMLDNVEVIPNGINTDQFRYSPERKAEFLKKINISGDNLLLGNIGRFQEQKNHRFMIEVLEKVLVHKKNTLLLLVGEGELKEEIVNISKEKGIDNHIVYLGERKDIGDFLSAIDVFIFPSLFEGFGIAALEAQAAGVRTIVSNTIPSEVNVTGEVTYLPIDNVEIWADKILSLDLDHDRLSDNEKVKNSIYDADNTAKRMSEIYSGY